MQAALPLVQETYGFLHRNPELGKKEVKAHDYLRGRMEALGFKDFVASTRAPTAVIAVLDTGRAGAVVGLRAEMDARPLTDGLDEPAAHSPRSETPGVMHNCGHDAHAAMLLGAASVLVRNLDKLSGKIVFIFQPAEETAGGADDLVNEGLITRLGLQALFAQHSAPGLPVGTIAVAPGAILAGSNNLDLVFTGRGSHAAAPPEGDDVLLSAAKVVEDLSQAPARRLDLANRPVVVSITRFFADGGARNVLPSRVEASGTLRAFEDVKQSPPGQASIEQLLETRAEDLARVQGLALRWTLAAASPPTTNDPHLFETVTPKLAAAFPGRVDTTPSRGMFAEDFAFYTPHVASLYLSWGVAKDGLGQGGLHTRDFTVHPDAFAFGVTTLSLLAEIATTGRSDWRPVGP